MRQKIGESVYLGEVAQYDFIAGGTRLKIVEMNPQFAGASATGELTASVDPEDVVVLAE